MYKKIIENEKYFLLTLVLMLILVNLYAWFPNFQIDFLNDDYQIIGIHQPKSFIDCFSPFFSTDILGSYWRPAVNTFHRLTIYFFGFNPGIFHFTNWLLYLGVCILTGIFFYRAGLKKYAIFGAILFSVLPAHEIVVGWLSGRNETFMLIFILLNAILLLKENLNIKQEIIYYFCFLIAILTKESAYIAALMPILFYIFHFGFKFEKDRFYKFLRLSSVSLGIIAITIIYRLTIIGSNPAESSHFADLSVLNIIRNFFVAFPLSFLTADNTELFVNLFQDKFFLSILGLIAVALFLGLFKYVQYFFQIKDYKKVVFGLLWFGLYIIPPLPNMMRWYVLTASIGLMFSILSFVDEYKKNFEIGRIGKISLISVFSIVILIFANINRVKMQDWVDTSIKTQSAIKSIAKLDLTGIKTLYLWAAPDKINRINSMKLGIEHSINIINNSKFNVINPLKAEINFNQPISCFVSDSMLTFKIIQSRFLPFKGKSMYLIKDEKIELEDNAYKMTIETTNKEGKIESIAKIRNLKSDSSTAHIFYDGDIFRKINLSSFSLHH